MHLSSFEEYVDELKGKLDRKRQLCDMLEEQYGGYPEALKTEDRDAFKHVFGIVAAALDSLVQKTRSPRALRRAYIDYLEGEAAETIEEMGEDYEQSIEDGNVFDDTRPKKYMDRIYAKVETQRQLLASLPEEGPEAPPRDNPFLGDEDIPLLHRMPSELAALNAPDASERFPWVGLKTADDFATFIETEAADFLKEPNAWDSDEVRKAKQQENMVWLLWHAGGARYQAPEAVKEAYEAWELARPIF
jgi:hypothetical protein